MGFTVTHSYSDDFIDLFEKLRSKYGKKLFDLDGIGSQLDFNEFRENFFGVSVAADGSVDPNANVDDVSPISFAAEFSKPSERLDSYFVLYQELLNITSKKEADEIIERQLIGDIYINDMHGISSRKPYCFNYATFDVLTMGLPMVNKIVSMPPKHLLAFRSQLEQFIIIASNSTLGATGMADLLISMSYYMRHILNTKSDAHFHFATEDDCWEYFKQTLVSFIYTMNQPLRSQQCFDDKTELLTVDGWKTYDELSEGQMIYTWGKDSGNLNVQPITHLNVQEYSGEMHLYGGRDFEFMVTPNHRILRKKHNTSGESIEDYDVKYSSELITKDSELTIPIATLDNTSPDYPIDDNLLKAIVIFLTDGTIKCKDDVSGRRPSIAISKSPRRWGGTLIKEVYSKLGKFSVKRRPSTWGEIDLFHISVDASAKVFDYAPYKDQLPECFKYLSKRQARLVLDLWSKFDGHIDSHGNTRKVFLQCDNIGIANGLQHLAVLAGYGSKICTKSFPDGALLADGNERKSTLYLRLYENTRKTFTRKSIVDYNGIIWCPTVDDGLIIVRRDGKVFVSGNSPFTNVSIYDRSFLESLVADIIFPDGTRPDIDLIMRLQDIYIDTMNEEMERTPITFPVTTLCLSTEDGEILDPDFLEKVSPKAIKYGFLNVYMGESSTLSSCCRLRSSTKNEFFNSFGAGSSKIGSLGVVTINFPRLAYLSESVEDFEDNLKHLIYLTALVNKAKRNIIQQGIDCNKEPLYNYGFMELEKQYSTTGVNGFYECLDILGYNILTKEGQDYAIRLMKLVNDVVDDCQEKYHSMHNIEQIPGENTSIKFSRKDKYLGYDLGLDLYSNQFVPLTSDVSMLDRIIIQGKMDKWFSGGSVLHLHIDSEIDDPKDFVDIVKFCAKSGVVYFAVNYLLNKCENGHMTVGLNKTCSKCGAKIIGKYTRVVGFLTEVSNWHKVRREKDFPNRRFYGGVNVSDAGKTVSVKELDDMEGLNV